MNGGIILRGDEQYRGEVPLIFATPNYLPHPGIRNLFFGRRYGQGSKIRAHTAHLP